MRRTNIIPTTLLIFLMSLFAATAFGQAPTPEQVEFFEKKVRPVLAERCFSCHSAKAAQNGLRLDSRDFVLKGGARGPALVAGQPDKSLIVTAIGYRDFKLLMPPQGRLADAEIAALTEWVKMGAPWPAADKPAAPKPSPYAFNLKERAKFWSFQPIRRPTVPKANHAAWVKNPIDAFLLAKMEAAHIAPAKPADRRTLLRRVTYDLIGLPPTPAEIAAFVRDKSPNAYEKVVDRLLASPHYGERWARRWLDLARFAETDGHEFDYDKIGAWRYRDYVIRAFNADVPYNQFVMEQIAGDLLPHPRLNPKEGFNESLLGTGLYWLGEGTHSPTDLEEDEATRVDNQIDATSKTFLGLSMGCARCHDHKFDPISTKDYYALAGYFKSARRDLLDMTPRERLLPTIRELEKTSAELESLAPSSSSGAVNGPKFRLRPGQQLFADFSGPTWNGWTATGEAFGDAPRRTSVVVQQVGGKPRVTRVASGGVADSGALSERLTGTLRSPNFIITKPRILYHVAGHDAAIRLIIDGFQLIQDPIYGGLQFGPPRPDRLEWHSQDVSKWIGLRAYVEIPARGNGRLIADGIVFSDTDDAPNPPPPFPDSPHSVRREAGVQFSPIQNLGVKTGFRVVGDDKLRPFAEANGSNSPFPVSEANESGKGAGGLGALMERKRELEAALPAPEWEMVVAEGTGVNDRVHIRGVAKTLGAEVPRRFLEACGGTKGVAPTPGSGRLELAERMVSPSDPLLPRVMVNRLWRFHFGEGIVGSPDDFGKMGKSPTNPQLLDFLASEFVRQGWSAKKMHRLMVLSSAYRMSSAGTTAAERADPTNALLHRMPVRRLEAEEVRDAILAVSGRLDETLYGPSVEVYLTSFMLGRGRPAQSGPLDGDGRRSIYIHVRRNFLTPMLLAFDYPVPFNAMGRRSVSNVPAQALTLMNDPFVVQQAEVWAKRVLDKPGQTRRERVEEMFLTAFARPPDAKEIAAATEFLANQDKRYNAPDDSRSWRDLCHVFFNLKEFIFIN